MNANPERLHELDGLRAIAASLVLIHHLATGSLAVSLEAQGHRFAGALIGSITASGVELFFVLSAIVLVRPYVRGERPFSAGLYFRRRVQRLWPPYAAAWLLAGLAIFLATRFPTWWTATARLPAFSFEDWLAQTGIFYVGRASFNFAWWSLSVELLFYALVPLLLPLFLRTRHNLGHRILLFVAAATIAVLANAIAWPGEIAVGPLQGVLTYASCFCAGLLLAQGMVSSRLGLSLLSVGLAWVVMASLYPPMNVHVGWGCAYFGLVVLALNGGRLSRLLSSPLLVWLGERSYSLFLVHYAVIVMVCHAVSIMLAEKGPTYFALTRALAIPLSLLAAMMVFHTVERRFARGLVTADTFWPPLRTFWSAGTGRQRSPG